MSAKDTTYESKVLSTLYNPFSLKNLDPKWPDGLCNSSRGVQMKRTTELNGSEIVIALIPGYVNWCFAFQWDEVDNRWNLLMNHCDNTYIMSHLEQAHIIATPSTVPQEYTYEYAFGAQQDSQDIGTKVHEPEFSSWRGVSYGLRMMNVNSDHDNDGWFECVRTSRNAFVNRLGLALILQNPPPEGPTGANVYEIEDRLAKSSYGDREKDNIYIKPGCVFPLTSTAQEWFSARNWAIMPSYASGKLKELKDFVFSLNPEKAHNDFQKIEYTPFSYTESISEKISINTNIGVAYNNYDTSQWFDELIIDLDTDYAVVGMVTENQDSAGGNTKFTRWVNFQKGFTSPNFDIILVKIHGLANTRTVVSSVANLEFQINERKNEGYHNMTNSYACLQSLDKYIESRVTYNRNPFQDISKKRQN